jgi:hypothetical protein
MTERLLREGQFFVGFRRDLFNPCGPAKKSGNRCNWGVAAR